MGQNYTTTPSLSGSWMDTLGTIHQDFPNVTSTTHRPKYQRVVETQMKIFQQCCLKEHPKTYMNSSIFSNVKQPNSKQRQQVPWEFKCLRNLTTNRYI